MLKEECLWLVYYLVHNFHLWLVIVILCEFSFFTFYKSIFLIFYDMLLLDGFCYQIVFVVIDVNHQTIGDLHCVLKKKVSLSTIGNIFYVEHVLHIRCTI